LRILFFILSSSTSATSASGVVDHFSDSAGFYGDSLGAGRCLVGLDADTAGAAVLVEACFVKRWIEEALLSWLLSLEDEDEEGFLALGGALNLLTFCCLLRFLGSYTWTSSESLLLSLLSLELEEPFLRDCFFFLSLINSSLLFFLGAYFFATGSTDDSSSPEDDDELSFSSDESKSLFFSTFYLLVDVV
jgi:hypothetical protein